MAVQSLENLLVDGMEGLIDEARSSSRTSWSRPSWTWP